MRKDHALQLQRYAMRIGATGIEFHCATLSMDATPATCRNGTI